MCKFGVFWWFDMFFSSSTLQTPTISEQTCDPVWVGGISLFKGGQTSTRKPPLAGQYKSFNLRLFGKLHGSSLACYQLGAWCGWTFFRIPKIWGQPVSTNWETAPGCLGFYRGGTTTQFCGDSNKTWNQDPFFKQPIESHGLLRGSSKPPNWVAWVLFFADVAQNWIRLEFDCWTFFVWSIPRKLRVSCYVLLIEKKVAILRKNIHIQSQVEKTWGLTYCSEIYVGFPSEICSNFLKLPKRNTEEDLLLSFGYGSVYSQCHPAGCYRGRYSVRMTQEVVGKCEVLKRLWT